MIKYETEYHKNFEVKSVKEFNDGELCVISLFDDQGNLLYKENIELIYIFEYNPDGTKLFYLENKLKDTWERSLYDQDDNKLLGERSTGIWFESRYNDNGSKIFFMNSDGSVHTYSKSGTIYSQVEDPEKHCTFKINLEKTPNKFGRLIK
jgi:hypothetical protein